MFFRRKKEIHNTLLHLAINSEITRNKFEDILARLSDRLELVEKKIYEMEQ